MGENNFKFPEGVRDALEAYLRLKRTLKALKQREKGLKQYLLTRVPEGAVVDRVRRKSYSKNNYHYRLYAEAVVKFFVAEKRQKAAKDTMENFNHPYEVIEFEEAPIDG